MTNFSDAKWQLLCEASNRLEAIFIKGRLEAEGIPVHIVSEAVAELYGITHGWLALAKVYVPGDRLQSARAILEESPPPPPDP